MPAVKDLGTWASCPLAGETPTLQALGRMKDADGMQVEVDAGRMPALPGHNRADKEWNRRAVCRISEVIPYFFPGASFQM